MRNCWIVKGSVDNWKLAFTSQGIWGLKDESFHKVF